jgi:hypothetical protein
MHYKLANAHCNNCIKDERLYIMVGQILKMITIDISHSKWPYVIFLFQNAFSCDHSNLSLCPEQMC